MRVGLCFTLKNKLLILSPKKSYHFTLLSVYKSQLLYILTNIQNHQSLILATLLNMYRCFIIFNLHLSDDLKCRYTFMCLCCADSVTSLVSDSATYRLQSARLCCSLDSMVFLVKKLREIIASVYSLFLECQGNLLTF